MVAHSWSIDCWQRLINIDNDEILGITDLERRTVCWSTLDDDRIHGNVICLGFKNPKRCSTFAKPSALSNESINDE
jgi:hypothetical protein